MSGLERSVECSVRVAVPPFELDGWAVTVRMTRLGECSSVAAGICVPVQPDGN